MCLSCAFHVQQRYNHTRGKTSLVCLPECLCVTSSDFTTCYDHMAR